MCYIVDVRVFGFFEVGYGEKKSCVSYGYGDCIYCVCYCYVVLNNCKF